MVYVIDTRYIQTNVLIFIDFNSTFHPIDSSSYFRCSTPYAACNSIIWISTVGCLNIQLAEYNLWLNEKRRHI